MLFHFYPPVYLAESTGIDLSRLLRSSIWACQEYAHFIGNPRQVVVIAGASSGIGEASALLLAERRAKVVRGSDRLKALALVLRMKAVKPPMHSRT
jgi:hypothetical protein